MNENKSTLLKHQSNSTSSSIEEGCSTKTSDEDSASYSIPVVITEPTPQQSKKTPQRTGMSIIPPTKGSHSGPKSDRSNDRLIINLSPKNSPRFLNSSDPSSTTSRSFLSLREHSSSSSTASNSSDEEKPEGRKGLPLISPRKILNLKNHTVEIATDQPLNEAMSQFISPRLESSPRVLESRMIELQLQHERTNAHLTKMNEKKSEEIIAQSARINELLRINDELRNTNYDLMSQVELSKKVSEVTASTEIDKNKVIDALTHKLTGLAVENMKLRASKDKVQGASIVFNHSIELLEQLKREDDNIALLKSDLFDLKQKQLSYDQSVELYEQELRKVINSAKHSIRKEKEKRKQMEQEILILQSKIRELEFFIIEELADVSEFSSEMKYEEDEG